MTDTIDDYAYMFEASLKEELWKNFFDVECYRCGAESIVSESHHSINVYGIIICSMDNSPRIRRCECGGAFIHTASFKPTPEILTYCLEFLEI